jgi:hypothetical protein
LLPLKPPLKSDYPYSDIRPIVLVFSSKITKEKEKKIDPHNDFLYKRYILWSHIVSLMTYVSLLIQC